MKQILLVDDDERIRETVTGFFESSDVELMSVANGNDALAVMASGRIDLIITDLFMATLNGIELIGRIRKIDPALPVVLITGGAENFPFGSSNLNSLTEIAEVLGACHILYKPFRRAELLTLINGILEQPVPAPEEPESPAADAAATGLPRTDL